MGIEGSKFFSPKVGQFPLSLGAMLTGAQEPDLHICSAVTHSAAAPHELEQEVLEYFTPDPLPFYRRIKF